MGDPDDIRRAADASQGLGLFVRSLIGMDREAAKDALAGFIDGRALSANQLEFVNLVVDHLTEHGLMQPARLYESPFTDLTRGARMVFSIRRTWADSSKRSMLFARRRSRRKAWTAA